MNTICEISALSHYNTGTLENNPYLIGNSAVNTHIHLTDGSPTQKLK